jgi:hypothetical protein
MDESILKIISESKSLNSKVFSLPRLQLLGSLAELGPDGATFRELKAALELNDGVLYANLEALKEMGYPKAATVKVENKMLESYAMTRAGLEAWTHTKVWLCRFICCGRCRQ